MGAKKVFWSNLESFTAYKPLLWKRQNKSIKIETKKLD